MAFEGKTLLFFGNGSVKNLTGDAKISVNKPCAIKTAFIRDKKWENFIYLYSSFIYDEEAKEYRIYYGARDKKRRTRLCLATSKDGIHYKKPSLNLYEYEGSKKNNIVKGGAGDGVVYLDPTAPREERYKHLYHGNGLKIDYSADGIHWKNEPTLLCQTFNDGFNSLFYDKFTGKYRLFLRGWSGKKLHRMAVTVETDSVGRDFKIEIPATAKRRKADENPYMSDEYMRSAIDIDESFPPNTDIYTFAPVIYPSQDRYYICFPALYLHKTKEEGGRYENDGVVTSSIFTSRDGYDWSKHNLETYMGNAENGVYQNNMAYMGSGVLMGKKRMLTCGTLYEQTHGDVESRHFYGDGKMMIYEQRSDGYISADFGKKGGCLLTTECLLGERIAVNAKTAATGTLEVSAIAEGKEVPLFSFTGDEENYAVNLPSSLAGQRLSLKVSGRNAKLYAIKFS